MLEGLLNLLIRRRSGRAYDRSFVIGVAGPQVARARSPRNPRVEHILVAGWAVIAVKSAGVFWLFDRYHVPVNPWWVVGPTLFFAVVVTIVYLLRD